MTSDMNNVLLWELAQNSAQEVAVVTAGLIMKESQDLSQNRWKMPLINSLGQLAAYLQCVSFDSARCDAQDGTPGKVEQFLVGLELLCTWPPKNIPDGRSKDVSTRFPTLHFLSSRVLRQNEVIARTTKLEGSLKAFVSGDSRRVKRYCSFLEGFSSAKDESQNQAQATQADITAGCEQILEPTDGYPAHVHKAFYTIVKRYSQCGCTTSDVQSSFLKHHEGRLRLRENFQIHYDDVVFDSVFSRYPQEGTTSNVEWQHLRFYIPRRRSKQPGSKSVTIAAPEHSSKHPTKPAPNLQYADTVRSPSEFCELLRKRFGPAKICLKVKGETLSVLRDPEELEDDIVQERSISLANVLKERGLVAKKKLILAYILARSFWQFYDSDLMSVQWTTETVQFFRERNVEERLLDASPYFALPVQRDDSLLTAEYLATEYVVHRYPRVLALGSMLLEIGGKRRKESTGDALDEVTTYEEKIGIYWNDIRSALKRKTWPKLGLQGEVQETYRFIVKNCSDPKLFETNRTDPSTQENVVVTIEDRRDILYKRVVYPLKILLEKLGWIDKSGNVLREDDEQQDDLSHHDPDIVNPRNPVAFLNMRDKSNLSKLGSESEQWLLRVQSSEVSKRLFAGFAENQSLERIRIAVLDTGYDPEATFFKDSKRKRRIQEWKDCVLSNSVIRQDTDGHGTHVLSLLMKVAPAANFYVVRVAEGTHDLSNSTSNVAEAIRWAATNHQADIISLSFGFDAEVPIDGERVISNAISEALQNKNQRILFFAAAANEGGNQPEMFPANHPQVISIRGTDDKGWLQRFNPPRNFAGFDCFMTLGLDVPGACLSKDGWEEVCKSGTSVSTPIAAGIAAMLLGYARLYEADLRRSIGVEGAWSASELWTVTAMRRLLRMMSTEMLDKWCYLSAEEFTRVPHGLRLAMLARAVWTKSGGGLQVQ